MLVAEARKFDAKLAGSMCLKDLPGYLVTTWPISVRGSSGRRYDRSRSSAATGADPGVTATKA